jgi:hypothetical protein
METTGTLKENIQTYAKTQFDILKLKAISKGGQAASGAIVGVALAFLAIFILMFLSFSAAYAISSATNRPYLGFLIVAGFYIILAVLVVVLREKLITLPIVNSLLNKFYNNPEAERRS